MTDTEIFNILIRHIVIAMATWVCLG